MTGGKRTWKLGLIRGEVADVMARAPTLKAAARALGVDRTTLHRWIRDGKVTPRHARRSAHQGQPAAAPPPVGDGSWAAVIRARYEFSETESELVDLAAAALVLARDETLKPADRLAAMGRFSQLTKRIFAEEEPQHGHPETPIAQPRAAGRLK